MSDTIAEIRYRPTGSPRFSAGDFTLAHRPAPPLDDGQVRIALLYVSVDPYVRIVLKSRTAGALVPGRSVGRVIESASPEFRVGELVAGELAWATQVVVTSERLERVEPIRDIELHHYTGALGLSGITAYFGMVEVCRPKPGQRIVISGAYGGVGQIAGQIARMHGADVLGIVGSPVKIDRLRDLGISGITYTDPEWTTQLAEWADSGIDTYFDNVWGRVSEAVVPHLRERGQVALCGQISGYERARIPPLDIDWYLFLTRSLTLRGFRAVDFLDRYDEARTALTEWILDGRLRQDVEFVDGLEALPGAFARMLNSGTTGKLIAAIDKQTT